METNPQKPRIIVGVDAEPESMVALRWAAREAATTGSALVVVHAFEWLAPTRMRTDDYYFPLNGDGLDKTAREQYEQGARDLAETAVGVVAEVDAGIKVVTKVVEGAPFEVLTEQAQGAALLVLGSHGRGLMSRMLLGSVSSAIGSNPPCPVMVVRTHTRAIDTEATDMPVVVGIDGSASSRTALRWAADHAARNHARLVAVHGFRPVDQRTAGTITEQSGRRLTWLTELVEPVEKEHPGLNVTCTVTEDRPAQALIEWSVAARLVVVGTGGRSAFTGSVGQALLHHSWSPVAILPEA